MLLNPFENQLRSVAFMTEKITRFEIASDLHDGLYGDLYAVRNHLIILSKLNDRPENVEICALATKSVDEALKNTRQISHGLKPPLLENYGLVQAIESYCQDITVFKVKIFDYSASYQYDVDVAYELFRILQELLTNLIKHGNAKNCIIEFYDDGKIVMKNDGIYFSILNEREKHLSGAGMINIFARLQKINSTIEENKSETLNNCITIKSLI